jgi:hypothetical protein
MKGYTVFNVEQIDGLPEGYYAKPASRIETLLRIEHAESFFAATAQPPITAAIRLVTFRQSTISECRLSGPSAAPRAITPPSPMRPIMP